MNRVLGFGLPTGEYRLPGMHEYVVTQTVVRPRVEYADWQIAHPNVTREFLTRKDGERVIYLHAAKPSDVDVYHAEGYVLEWEDD